MKELKVMDVIGPDGKSIQLKVITIINKSDSNKKFLLYTFDDTSESIDIYASLIKDDANSYVLESITEEEDWNFVQKTIQELSE